MQCVGSGIAFDPAEVQIANAEHIIAATALDHIGAATADDHIVTQPGDEYLGTGAAGEPVGIRGAKEIDRVREIAAKNDMRFATIVAATRRATVTAAGTDDQIVEAIAVDIAGATNVAAAIVAVIALWNQESVGAVECGQLERTI